MTVFPKVVITLVRATTKLNYTHLNICFNLGKCLIKFNNIPVCCQSSQLIPAMTANPPDVPFSSLSKHLLARSFKHSLEDHKACNPCNMMNALNSKIYTSLELKQFWVIQQYFIILLTFQAPLHFHKNPPLSVA